MKFSQDLERIVEGTIIQIDITGKVLKVLKYGTDINDLDYKLVSNQPIVQKDYNTPEKENKIGFA